MRVEFRVSDLGWCIQGLTCLRHGLGLLRVAASHDKTLAANGSWFWDLGVLRCGGFGVQGFKDLGVGGFVRGR